MFTCKLDKMAHMMEDEVFMAFTTYSSIVILKLMLMGPLTAYYRFTRGVSNNIRERLSLVWHDSVHSIGKSSWICLTEYNVLMLSKPGRIVSVLSVVNEDMGFKMQELKNSNT